MKRKLFFLLAILAIAAISVFVTNQITPAQQRPEGRPGGPGGPGMGRMMSPTSLVDNSWVDLTFAVKVNDETLIKARPTYQRFRDDLDKTMKEARESGDFEGMREAMMKTRQTFKAELEKVLTKEQIAKLDELEQQRMQQSMRQREGGGGGPR